MKIPSPFGLAPKLLAVVALATVLVSVVMTWRASAVLDEQLTRDVASKGEAMALSLVETVERNAGGDPSMTQEAVDSLKNIQGVAYIYVDDSLDDEDDDAEVHTFSPVFPQELKGKNAVGPGELTGEHRVKLAALDLQLDTGGNGRRPLRALDVAAPISGGALGVVHVGMDRDVIDGEVRALRRSMLGAGSAASVLGIASALLLLVVVVIRPVRELTRVTSDIVDRGDLTQRIDIHSRDEIGQLAATFGQMVEKLRQIPASLQESTSILGTAVANLAKSTGEQSETLNRQAAALQETQVTAQEIKQTSLLAAQKAESVLQVAERADAVSRSGEAAIEQSMAGMGDLRQRVEEISQKIAQLSERTQQIGGITQTVKDLADQSNMLALNAAIEAVRSGEHGKGFAVVAREIRSLADQSIKATDRVREILEDISTAIRATVQSTERGAARMETSLVQVKTSGDNLRELSNIIKDNSAAVRQIAAAVNQQNAGITQIFTAVTDLSRMMEDAMSGVGSTTEATATLREVAERVQRMVQSYRV